jgi:hypothetical protein
MDEHPSHKVNKALRKKFLMLASKEQREAYRWFLVRLIGFVAYRSAELPRITGDKELVKAWRMHANDLIKVYAPRVRLTCGHFSRVEYCERCAMSMVESAQAQLDAIKKRKERAA